MADGILLTGSPSNVDPIRFDAEPLDESMQLDRVRDAWTLPIIRIAIERGFPLLGICRGLQEANVALGGSLHQAVHAQPELMDHRADPSVGVEAEYGEAHPVFLEPDGYLSHLLGTSQIAVNSIHSQGVKQLATRLRVEARAADGLIEAVSAVQPKGFAICVQWHPEWRASANPASTALFKAFGAACQAWRDVHRPPSE